MCPGYLAFFFFFFFFFFRTSHSRLRPTCLNYVLTRKCLKIMPFGVISGYILGLYGDYGKGNYYSYYSMLGYMGIIEKNITYWE